MKINFKKLTALLLTPVLLFGVLAACTPGGNGDTTTLESMAPVDDEWKTAVPSIEETTKPALTQAEIDAMVKEALGSDSGWDGDYAKLTDAQKEKIKNYFADKGYTIDLTGKGIVVIDKPSTSAPDVYEPAKPVTQKVLSGITAGTVTAFGGGGNAMFERVVATADGGYAATGFFSVASGDFSGAGKDWSGSKSMLVKYDKDGKVEWKAFLGGDGGGINFRGLTQLADKSYIVSGDTNSPELGAQSESVLDAVLVKYSAAGKQEWIKTVGGTKNEWFASVAATPDGGFLAGGKTESSDGDFEGLKADAIKAVLVKYDASGAVRWKRAISGSKHSDFENITVNKDGDIYATCKTYSNDGDFAGIAGRGDADTLVFSYDKNGKFNWVRSFSGSGEDVLTAITYAHDGGCVIAGKFSIAGTVDGSFAGYHNAGSYDGFMVKYNKNGTIGWAKPFAGFLYDEITGVVTVNGGYAAVGLSESNNRDFAGIGNKGGRDGFLLLVNELGETVAEQSLAGSAEDVPRAAASYDGTRIIVVGGTNSSDLFFAGLSPAVTKSLYNCFTATFTTQLKENAATTVAS
jgi:hypothetical protein